MILDYSRTKHASIIDLNDSTLLVQATVEDTYFSAAVEMEVKLPDLEIVLIKGEVKRAFDNECQKAVPRLQEAVGLRIGTGFIKAVNGLIGGSTGCPRMADLVLECCDEVILRFTVGPLRGILAKSGREQTEAYLDFARQNPRLAGSCIAFAEGGPLALAMEGKDV